MNLQDKVDLLVRLGLTPNQAKVYLALAGSSPCTANQVSKVACLASEVIYRTMPKLQEKGLVEKEIAVPAKFQATPLKLAIGMLLEQKNREDIQTRAKARKLLANGFVENDSPGQEDFKMILIPRGERLVQFIGSEIASVQRRLDVVVTGQKFSGWILAHSNLLQKVVSREVAVRVFVSGNECEYPPKLLEELLLNSNFRMRIVGEEVLSCVSVFDDRKAIISTSTDTTFARSPVYWSNNPSVVELCKTYFEKYWKKEANIGRPFVNARKLSTSSPECLPTQ